MRSAQGLKKNKDLLGNMSRSKMSMKKDHHPRNDGREKTWAKSTTQGREKYKRDTIAHEERRFLVPTIPAIHPLVHQASNLSISISIHSIQHVQLSRNAVHGRKQRLRFSTISLHADHRNCRRSRNHPIGGHRSRRRSPPYIHEDAARALVNHIKQTRETRIWTINAVLMFWGFYQEDVGLYVNNAIIFKADVGARGYLTDTVLYSKLPDDAYEVRVLREVIRYLLRRQNLMA